MNKFIFTAIFLLIFILAKTYTNTQIISVGAMTFAPATASVTVGDTIKWVWVERFHTTTSTTIPTGALPWDAPIDSTHPSFIYVVAVAGQYDYRCNFHYLLGMVGTFNASPIGIINITGNIPGKFELYQNYPNPFNPTTNIEFNVAENGFVSLKVFDITGREIENLVHENLQRGTYRVDWSGSGITSGVYFYTLKTSSFSDTKKMMLIK
ncbi:MAG TPA: T9SS type A sorting domain-containing protein [Ignavibacteria bacterium]|nr:T9SS type A sorting domain-containing protein [Ignavibacteria bacterium]